MDFPGCIIVVTHDRYFMDKMVDHLFVFEGNGKIKDYNGMYSDYRADKLEEEVEEKRLRNESLKKANDAPKDASGDDAKRLSGSERKEFKQLEREIADLEKKKATITEKFNDPNISQADMMKFSTDLGKIQESIETKEMRWMELAELVE
jgi:ABC transport system ATP-binding/permease protein